MFACFFCIAALLGICAGDVLLYDSMTSYNATNWVETTGRMHDQPGPGFEGRPDHLHFDSTGCVENLDNQPNCPSGCDSEPWAAGHLSSVQSYCYGVYTLQLRTAHNPSQGHTGTRAFTCYGMYSDVRVRLDVLWRLWFAACRGKC